jgi:hypothetical protein
MHGSAWCNKTKENISRVLLYTRSQTNFGKDQGLARGKGIRKG